MKKFVKVVAPLLMIAVSCTTLLSGLSFSASAASYVYNWGEREELATSLSQMAIDWYEDEGTSYAELSQLSGSSSTSSVPSSKLYKELQSLMKGAHSKITGYQETRSMYQYTDCENGGGKISSFYSGKAIGPSWDGGDTWNREHCWPNSKGLGGNDENDIMMLRPTSVSENSDRKNTAYGQSSGYYHPNSESDGKHDLRGDVARICLYVYCRWGNTGKMWGSSGVMESKDVLIQWMEEDPVDTWELGRNDSVQSITGTRNVFVDYPELGFLLFAEDIPADYQSPSGEGANGGGTPIVTTSTTATTTTTTTTTTKGQGGNVTTTTTTKGQGGKVTTTKGQGGTTTTTEQLSQEQAGNTTAGTQFRPGMAMGGTSSTTATTTTTAAESNADPDPLLDTTQWLIIAGAAVVIIGAVIVIVLVTRKKKV